METYRIDTIATWQLDYENEEGSQSPLIKTAVGVGAQAMVPGLTDVTVVLLSAQADSMPLRILEVYLTPDDAIRLGQLLIQNAATCKSDLG